MSHWVYGDQLKPEAIVEALNRFTNRYTGEHTPRWVVELAKKRPANPPEYRNDLHWLCNTKFCVTVRGALDKRISYCQSFIPNEEPVITAIHEARQKAGIK